MTIGLGTNVAAAIGRLGGFRHEYSLKNLARDASEETLVKRLPCQSVLLSVQPRIRLTRSFDQRGHTYLGYALKVRVRVGSKAREVLVGVAQGADTRPTLGRGTRYRMMRRRFRIRTSRPFEFYTVSKFKTWTT